MLAVMERWVTLSDGRACARCLGLNGRIFRQGSGPQPPLHDKCRCRRVFDHVQPFPDPAPAPEKEPEE
jgi:hypothetical protein